MFHKPMCDVTIATSISYVQSMVETLMSCRVKYKSHLELSWVLAVVVCHSVAHGASTNAHTRTDRSLPAPPNKTGRSLLMFKHCGCIFCGGRHFPPIVFTNCSVLYNPPGPL